MYSVKFSETAEKQLYKLEKSTQKRVIAVLERIKIRPFHFVRKIAGTSYYRLRVGDHRVILDIKENVIFVLELGHRKNVYKR